MLQVILFGVHLTLYALSSSNVGRAPRISKCATSSNSHFSARSWIKSSASGLKLRLRLRLRLRLGFRLRLRLRLGLRLGLRLNLDRETAISQASFALSNCRDLSNHEANKRTRSKFKANWNCEAISSVITHPSVIHRYSIEAFEYFNFCLPLPITQGQITSHTETLTIGRNL